MSNTTNQDKLKVAFTFCFVTEGEEDSTTKYAVVDIDGDGFDQDKVFDIMDKYSGDAEDKFSAVHDSDGIEVDGKLFTFGFNTYELDSDKSMKSCAKYWHSKLSQELGSEKVGKVRWLSQEQFDEEFNEVQDE